MAVDRDKVTRNALRFIQKGQYARAIEEYRKLLSADPGDIRVRLRLVDLYGRAGRRDEAVQESHRVAEAYADQGFYLKAIAVYKQALRHAPDDPALWRAMGEMYAKQGLVGDALNAFKRGVDVLRRQGDTAQAQELLTRMEQMAPDNAAIKVHLAELYLDEARYDAFEEALSKLVLQLRGEGRNRKLLHIVEGFYERSGHHPAVRRRLAELYVDLGEEEKAVGVIREGLAEDPEDRELRLLGLRAHLVLGNLEEARRMALDLHEQDPDDLFLLEQLAAIAQARGDTAELVHAYRTMAKVYGRRGIPDKEERCYRKVLELVPDDAEARLAQGEVLVGAEPEPRGGEPAQAPLPGAPGRPGAPDPLEEGLVEAELYLKYGMEDKAEEKLRELADRAPARMDLHRRLRDLYQRRGDRPAWVREQLRIAELLLREGRENEALRAYESILEVDPDQADARQAIRQLKPGALEPEAVPIEIEIDGAAVEFVGEGEGERAVRTGREEPAGPAAGSLEEALAEAEFYEAQGRTEEAVTRLLEARERFPGSPVLEARLVRLGWEPPPAPEEEGFIDLQGEVLDDVAAPVGGPAGFEDFEVSELDDIVQEFKSGIAEKLDEGDYETHYNLGMAYREMGLVEDALQEFRVAARSQEKARDAYTAMALVYREQGNRADARAALKMALAAPSNTPEDRAAILYELGDLAEEEGDFEGSLGLFERAARERPGFRDVESRIRRLRTLEGG